MSEPTPNTIGNFTPDLKARAMMTMDQDLAAVRRAFANRIVAAVGSGNERIERAFATVAREDFVGPGPWPVFRGGKYVPTPDADPIHVYENILIGLVPERGLNNGEPTLHALMLSCADPKAGTHIVHVGAGVGYYSAIMAELVGPSGRVTAIEYDAGLAERARTNLAKWPNVHVVHGDGTLCTPPSADIIYVNAGATHPADAWLDALTHDGRLLLPLTAPALTEPGGMPRGWSGAIFMIERRGDDYFVFTALPTIIFPCAGARDDASETALSAAFASGSWRDVRRLYRHGNVPAENCWLRTPTWSLAYR